MRTPRVVQSSEKNSETACGRCGFSSSTSRCPVKSFCSRWKEGLSPDVEVPQASPGDNPSLFYIVWRPSIGYSPWQHHCSSSPQAAKTCLQSEGHFLLICSNVEGLTTPTRCLCKCTRLCIHRSICNSSLSTCSRARRCPDPPQRTRSGRLESYLSHLTQNTRSVLVSDLHSNHTVVLVEVTAPEVEQCLYFALELHW